MNNNCLVVTAGWEQVDGIPPEDYRDFECVRQSMDEVRHCLNAGHFPPGLILFDGKTRAKVTGKYLEEQKLKRLQ